MSDRDSGPSLESRHQIASEIYRKLQDLRGSARLESFNQGEAIYPEIGKRIKIARLNLVLDQEKEWFRERGFTEEDLSSGITAIIEYQFLNPNWPKEPFKQEPRIGYYNISGKGKIVKSSEDKWQEVEELNPEQLDALQRISQLFIIPRQILEVFETYDEFVEAVGNFDGNGIDGIFRGETTPTQSLYKGGLNSFVIALILKQRGELGNLDTGLHALRDSLDNRSHFAKIFETLNNKGQARQ